MSRVECDHCGARYELPTEDSTLEGSSEAKTVTCRECGAPARSSAAESVVASSTPATPTPPIEINVEEPEEGETIPAPKRPSDESAEEPVTTRTPPVLRDVTEASEDDEKTITRQTDLSAEADEAPPVSGTPSIDALIRARTRREQVEAPPGSRSFLDAPRYDLRPPDIQVESSRRPKQLRTDAPVTGTNRPPSSGSRSSNRAEVLVALALFSAAGAFFALRSLRDEGNPSAQVDTSLPGETANAVAQQVEEPVIAPPQAQPEPVVAAEPQIIAAPAPEEPKVLAPAVQTRKRRHEEPAVLQASLTKEAEPAVVAEALPPPFDANAAGEALALTTKQASTCRKSSDPSGVATVTLTFSPSGRVTTAQISGPPFAGTETGSCIASELRKTRVPAFNGEFVTVKKTVTIQ